MKSVGGYSLRTGFSLPRIGSSKTYIIFCLFCVVICVTSLAPDESWMLASKIRQNTNKCWSPSIISSSPPFQLPRACFHNGISKRLFNIPLACLCVCSFRCVSEKGLYARVYSREYEPVCLKRLFYKDVRSGFLYAYTCFHIYIYSNLHSMSRIWQWSFFKRSLIGLNLEFSFS